MNEQNLRPCTPENARERQLKGAQKRKENTQRRQFLSEMYADFLSEKFDVKVDGAKTKITGAELCKMTAKQVLNKGGQASVSMLTEIRKATESESVLEKLKAENEKHISKEAEFFQFRLQKRLFDKQKDVFNDFISKRKCSMCSRRAGKTEEATDEMLKVAAIPNSPVLYINLTFDNAIKQTYDKVLAEAERVDLKITKKSKSEGYIEFENGSSILFKGNKDKGEADKMQGFHYRLVIIDEAQSQCNMVYLIDTIITPMLTDFADSVLYLIGTPPRRKYTYFENAFNNKTWKHFHWTMADNPFIPDVDAAIKRICEEKGLTVESPLIQREYFGKIAYDTEAQIFKGFQVYSGDIPAEFIPDHIYGGNDFGFSDYNGVIELEGNVTDKKAYVVFEKKFNKSTITEIINQTRTGFEEATMFALKRNKSFDLSNRGIYTDDNEKSIAYEMHTTYGLPAWTAYKYDRDLAIEQLAEWCRLGRIVIPEGGELADEFEQILHPRDEQDNILPGMDDSYHPDITMALLYAFRQFLFDCGEDLGGESKNKQSGEF